MVLGCWADWLVFAYVVVVVVVILTKAILGLKVQAEISAIELKYKKKEQKEDTWYIPAYAVCDGVLFSNSP